MIWKTAWLGRSPTIKNMNEFYKNKKVLITGHTGFQGAWLAQILLNMGAEVVGVALRPHTNPNLFVVLGLKNKLKNYFVDIGDIKKLNSIFKKEKPEIIFHLAAQAIVLDGYAQARGTYQTNMMGTVNVLEAARLAMDLRALVVITTDKVYANDETGRPFVESDKLGGFDPYSASKAAADITTQSYISSFFSANSPVGARVGIARSGNVIGGGDWGNFRLVPDIIRSIYENKQEFVLRHPRSIRPWQHVFEALYGYLRLGQGLCDSKINLEGAWNFGPDAGSNLTVAEIVEKIFALLSKVSYRLADDPSRHEAGLLMLDNNKAKTHLGWKPILSLDQCLALTTEWYRTYYEDRKQIITLSNHQINSFFGK